MNYTQNQLTKIQSDVDDLFDSILEEQRSIYQLVQDIRRWEEVLENDPDKELKVEHKHDALRARMIEIGIAEPS